ncbi:MAG: hypothetical protein WDA07_05535 [Leucobacter sp.]
MSPDERTSNYGWALWHLQQSEESVTVESAMTHAVLAQARATLAAIDDNASARGEYPPEFSKWEKAATDD